MKFLQDFPYALTSPDEGRSGWGWKEINGDRKSSQLFGTADAAEEDARKTLGLNY